MSTAQHAAQIQGKPHHARYLRRGGISYFSVEGTTSVIFGITELGDVSDPPRKYLRLYSNRGYPLRDNGVDTMEDASVGLVQYDDDGNLLTDFSTPRGGPSTLATATGGELTYEGVTPAAGFADPVWDKAKTLKFFDSLDPTPSEDPIVWRLGAGLLFYSGILGTNSGMWVRFDWDADHWDVTGFIGGGGVGVGFTAALYLFVKIVGGDQDPGTVATFGADPFVVAAPAQPSGGGGPGASFAFSLPPNVSLRFALYGDFGGNSWSFQFPTVEADALNPFRSWLYLPADSSELEQDRYAEGLAEEMTYAQGLENEGGFIAGRASLAFTDAVSGGVGAESHDPIEFTGRVVTVTRTFATLPDRLYSVTVDVEDGDYPGGASPTTAQLEFSFVTGPGETSHPFTFELRAPSGRQRRITGWLLTDDGARPILPEYQTETLLWWGNLLGAGGTLESDSIDIAETLMEQLNAKTYRSKLVYLAPLLGANLAAALTPLVDRDNRGRMTNVNFLDADFDQTTGLQGNGTTKRFIAPYTPAELGVSSSLNGGLGWWETNITLAGNVEPCGCYNAASSNRFVLDLRSNLRAFRWGDPANLAGDTAAAANGCFYGQRSSSTLRELFFNGASLGQNTTADATSGAADLDLNGCGSNAGSGGGGGVYPWPGRCGAFFLTDGTLSAADALDLFETLRDYLMDPTARI